MRFETAIEHLVDNYRYAKSKVWIRDEVAWALYHTWKEADDRKTEPQTEKFPQKWTDWCKECGKKERCVRAGFMPQCYESEDEPQTERSE